MAMPAGLEYIQHTVLGSELAEPELATWVFRWTTPDADDPVIFHVAANSANGDNSPFGDYIYTAEARSSGRDEYR